MASKFTSEFVRKGPDKTETEDDSRSGVFKANPRMHSTMAHMSEDSIRTKQNSANCLFGFEQKELPEKPPIVERNGKDKETKTKRKRRIHKKRQPHAGGHQSGNVPDDLISFDDNIKKDDRKPAVVNLSTDHPASGHGKRSEKSLKYKKGDSAQIPTKGAGKSCTINQDQVQVQSFQLNSNKKSTRLPSSLTPKNQGKQRRDSIPHSSSSSTQNLRVESNKNPSQLGAPSGVKGKNTYSDVLKQNPDRKFSEKRKTTKKRNTESQTRAKNVPEKDEKMLKEFYENLNLHTLRKLNKGKPDEIVKTLISVDWFKDFQTCIKKEKVIQADLFQVLLEILTKTSKSVRMDDINQIYSQLLDSLFLLKHVPYHMGYMATTSPQNGVHVFSNVIEVLTVLVQKFPGCYEVLPINVLKRVQEKLQLSTAEMDVKSLNKFNQLVESDFNQLVEIYEELSKPKPRNIDVQSTNGAVKIFKKPDEGPPPNDFRSIPMLPSPEDIFRDDNPYLRKNVIKGPYTNLEHYLDVHFRLLYEDFQAPLREGVNMLVARVEARKKEPEKMRQKGIGRIDDVHVYEGVRIMNPKCEREGLMFRLTFDVSKLSKFTDWRTTKRFTYGSLLCLSKDNFQTFFFATVANKDEKDLRKGMLDIKILLCPHAKVSLGAEDVYLMAESRAYFEACRHVLTRLQLIEELPFQQYLVQCTPDVHVDAPAYLRLHDIQYDFSSISTGKSVREANVAPVLNPDQWPSAASLELNDSQFKALETALTKELALIQGPPGTGKTYVGLKIAKLLLANKKKTDLGPILVVCYTNHALDQFLEGIFQFWKRGIVRIGGRSSSDVMNECSLRNFVYRWRKQERCFLNRYELNNTKDKLQKVVEKIREVNEKLLQEPIIREVVKKDLIESLVCDRDGYIPSFNEALLRWLNLFSDDAEINEEEVTVLLQSDDGKVFTKQSLQVESVQLTERDFWVMAIVRTTTGGGILARSLKKPRISQTWFIDDEGYLAFEEAREKKIRFSLRGTIKINDNQWHEVVMAYEEQEKKISLFVDKNLEAEKDGCSFHKYNMKKERVFVGSNPFHDSPELNEIEIKYMAYIPNAIPIFNASSEKELQEPDLPEVQLLSEADFIEEQRMIEGDHDVEGFEPQPEPKPTMLDKILAQRKDSRGGWSVVKNKKNAELFKFQQIVKRELAKEDFISIEDSEKVKDVWELKPQDRWKLYRGWMIAAKKEYDWEMATKQVEYEDAIEACNDAESEQDSKLLIKHASVIGMTTTGAAKRPKLLKGIGARVVIVEEAAEVLESHIVTSLTRECQHLILIGDHQQLRPTPNVYDLVTNFNFDVSLFERMINNGLDFVCLKKQHRMRPEISQVCRHIYPDLEDHESVFRFDNIAGVKHNIYFVSHEYMEVTEEDTASHVNRHEARFLVALCKYLFQQGYKASQITILTPYTGQMREIQKCTKNVLPRPRHGEKSVRVTSIDNYQGEENDIILLSLVRSNKRENIGFLKIDNRVCVALSRAKKGLYCIGNMNMIRRRSKLWKNIVNDMEDQGLVGPKLALCCQMHGDDERINVETPDDFQRAPNGGCTRICRKELSCGHICNKMCHPVDQEHVDLHKCRAPCEKVPCSLHPNRRCTKRCSDKCSPCREVVQKILPMCKHEQDMFCHEDPSNSTCKTKCPEWLECGHQCQSLCSVPCGPCKVLVKKPLPDCDHEVEMPCYEDPQKFICELQCSKEHSCGHQCSKKCHLPCGKCMEKVTKLLPNCNHQMELACYKDPKTVRCNLPCTKILDCGHPCTKRCGYECNAVCNYQCLKEFDCGHQCPNLCSAPCPPCEVQIQVTLPKCGHMTTIQCCQSLDNTVRCSQRCQLSLDCGHVCTGYCSEKCIPCRRIVRRTIPGCGHQIKALCSTPQENILCPVPCEKILPECGHQCQKKCHMECTPCMKMVRKTLPRCYHLVNAPCSTAASEVSCPLPCTAMLPCGHQCTKTCSEVCNPCQQVVSKEIPRCKHKQDMACSTPPEEVYCRSPCPKKLSCGHFCPQKCSDARCGPCISSEMVAKVLPCGHENKVPCKQDPSTFTCTKQRLMSLPCGHDKAVPCISKFERFSCNRMCRSRGNMNCGPACGKCLVKWLKPLPCGHKVHVVCYKYKDATECLSCSGLFMKN